jgi:hypothetical protein
MENQCLGLAERLESRLGESSVALKIVTKRLAPRAPWKWLPESLFGFPWPLPFAALGSDSDALEEPWPDLVIACGRKTVAYSAAIKKRSKGKTFVVQTQDPRLDARFFDLVIPPRHDNLEGPNVLPILGSPNRITPARLREGAAIVGALFNHLPERRIAVLIGGSSQRFTLDLEVMETLADQLQDLARQGFGLMITTSRRTGEAQEKLLRERLTGDGIHIWDGGEPNPYFAMLAEASHILVTEESTNMITEAAATGKPVYILPLKGHAPKFERFHRGLSEAGITRGFEGALETWDYEPLDETGRAAGVIMEQLKSRSIIHTDS